MEIRKVSIRLRSVIDGDETHCEYIGEYRQMDGSHLIAYTDFMGNAITKVGIEARDNAMLLHRVGSITADMLFEPGTGTVVNYEALSLISGFILHTHDYHLIQGDEGFVIYIEYSLHDGSGEPAIRGTQEITITLLEDENA